MVTHDQDKTNLTGFELLYSRRLSKQEIFEIEHNLLGFFGLLLEIERRNQNNGAERRDAGSEKNQ